MIDEFLDYLSRHFELSGKRQVQLIDGTCPFCGESRSDLRIYINPKTGLGFCHHCGQGFSPVGFVAANESISLKAAQTVLNGSCSYYVAHEQKKPAEGQIKTIWPRLEPIDWLGAAGKYLLHRGIGQKVAAKHNLMFCSTNTQIGEDICWTANRIIFPIFDSIGSPTSWIGRDITAQSKCKYLIAPGFEASKLLFNLNNVVYNDYLILCEGAMDVIGWTRHNINNCVATFGKKISDVQLTLIKEINPKTLYLAWDNDAHYEIYNLCEKIKYKFNVRILNMKKDADELSANQILTIIKNYKKYSWNDKILDMI